MAQQEMNLARPSTDEWQVSFETITIDLNQD
jgi:hypothetical protein